MPHASRGRPKSCAWPGVTSVCTVAISYRLRGERSSFCRSVEVLMWDGRIANPSYASKPRALSELSNHRRGMRHVDSSRIHRLCNKACRCRPELSCAPSEVVSKRVGAGTRSLERKTLRHGTPATCTTRRGAGPMTARSISSLGNSELALGQTRRRTVVSIGQELPATSLFFGAQGFHRPGLSYRSKGDFIQRLNRLCSKPWPIPLPSAATSWNSLLLLREFYRYQGR